ncbi:MAG: polymer-forming cytoskeletal protein [Halioglobus sp.]|nr:polymer-forming cytoskeletal protein [Halioglobus sp.]
MWGSKKSLVGSSGGTTLIAEGTRLVGNVHFGGTLEVEGVVQGSILAEAGKEALVRVVGKGRVEGEIRAPNVMINGIVEGDVHSSGQLELAPRGRVNGNVYYNSLEMAAGAEVNGGLTHRGAEPEPVVAAPASAQPGAE